MAEEAVARGRRVLALQGEVAEQRARVVALEQQLARITAGTVSADLAANEAALRLLCIRAELIADLETHFYH